MVASPADLVAKLSSSGDRDARLKAVRDIKNVIIGNKQKKQVFVSLGAVPRVVELLSRDAGGPLLVQCAAAVGSFAYGLDAGVQVALPARRPAQYSRDCAGSGCGARPRAAPGKPFQARRGRRSASAARPAPRRLHACGVLAERARRTREPVGRRRPCWRAAAWRTCWRRWAARTRRSCWPPAGR